MCKRQQHDLHALLQSASSDMHALLAVYANAIYRMSPELSPVNKANKLVDMAKKAPLAESKN